MLPRIEVHTSPSPSSPHGLPDTACRPAGLRRIAVLPVASPAGPVAGSVTRPGPFCVEGLGRAWRSPLVDVVAQTALDHATTGGVR